jgi:hypothetical protein
MPTYILRTSERGGTYDCNYLYALLSSVVTSILTISGFTFMPDECAGPYKIPIY